MGIFLILLSITLVIFLVFKGVPVFYSAVLASMFCLLTAALFTGAGADTGMVNYLIRCRRLICKWSGRLFYQELLYLCFRCDFWKAV